MSLVFLKAKWLNLIMVNYEIDPTILKPRNSAYTELETYNGIHYVSLVGFLFKDTKVKGIPGPFHRTFEEINLRFYVRQKENNKWKRGVVFLKEIVSLPAITLMANLIYKEHYQTPKTQHVWNLKNEEWQVEYHWQLNNQWNFLKVTAASTSHPNEKGTEQKFIAIQNWGYTRINNNQTSVYQLHHPNWLIHPVRHHKVECNMQKCMDKLLLNR